MERQDQAGRSSVGRHVTLAGIVLLGSGWGAAALGASSADAGCDELSRDLQRLDITMETLEIDAVDHMPTGPDVVNAEPLDGVTTSDGPAAPVLYLTPRVATILREVFGTSVDDDAETVDAAAPVADDAEIEGESDIDSTEKTAPVTLIDQSEELPRFQRQMFRKDI